MSIRRRIFPWVSPSYAFATRKTLPFYAIRNKNESRNENVPHEFHAKRKLINGYTQIILNFMSVYNSTDKLNSMKKPIFYDNTFVGHVDFKNDFEILYF